ncbi:MAG: ORF6N domain-containing protein [Deltaproteobacteria bacterium]|nr:ORF6N domain-containing protein [Deltaproteobacteria bacterium]
MTDLVPIERIEQTILIIRGHKVILDADLATLYGVSIKRLNEQVKRNVERFPEDFMFVLSSKEMEELVANCDRFKNLKHSTVLPYAFTEHGTIMVANVLKSARAVLVSIQVIRAFVHLREILNGNRELARKLNELEKKYDYQFKIVFDAIRELMTPPIKPKRPIGFNP